jgi:exosortase family protein XrtF
LLSFGYSIYLKASEGGAYHPDFVTHLVAKQSTDLLLGFGVDAEIVAHQTKPQMVLNINKKYLGSIIEGCNSLSVIILFIAFIVAFAERIKKTVLFILAGAVLIYGINIIRIAILAVALSNYPHQEKILHGVVFPAIIYGMVFVLWMLWVRKILPKSDGKDA